LKKLLGLVLFISACGFNGDQKISTNDSKQDINLHGEAFTYVIVRLEFIQQINDLCKNRFLKSDYLTEVLYNQAVADCTLTSLALFNISPTTIKTFQDQYCKPGTDLSGYTPKEQGDILAACAAMAGK
jgi:hypothetical protein